MSVPGSGSGYRPAPEDPVEAATGDAEPNVEHEMPVIRRIINLTSGNSDDTLFTDAEGADEDDLEEEATGPRDQQIFKQLNKYLDRKHGVKGSAGRRVISIDELTQHDKLDDFWIVIDNKVFNMTPYLLGENVHPGGKTILQRQLAGQEGGRPGLKPELVNDPVRGGQIYGQTEKAHPKSRHDAELRFVRWHNPGGNAVRRTHDFFVGDLARPLPSSMRDPERSRMSKCGAICSLQ